MLPWIAEIDAGPEALIALLASIPARLRPAILDSGGDREPDGRFLIGGFDPFDRVECASDGDPLGALRVALERHAMEPTACGVPSGAAIAALSYDLGRRYERLPATARVDAPSPEVSIALYDRLFVHDYRARQSFIVSTGLPERGAGAERRARARIDDARNALRRVAAIRRTAAASRPATSNFTPDSYAAAVRRAQDYISAGDIFQVNLTQRFRAELGKLEPVEVFLRLRERNPAAFAAFLIEPTRQVVSASPERFLSVRGRFAEMWPIKGTRPRGETPADDARFAHELTTSEKDRAENVMIVDLVRNDLGRVAKYGTVRVDELCGLRQLPTVYHLVSRVSCTLADGASGCDLLRAAFPCGSITGAPKIRSMEIIEELEGVRRGLSMGAIGYASFDGAMDFSVAIRTMEILQNRAYFHVGGGIVADSDPAGEYEESLWKARALLDALRG